MNNTNERKLPKRTSSLSFAVSDVTNRKKIIKTAYMMHSQKHEKLQHSMWVVFFFCCWSTL